jgi:hypothetical protein
MEEEYCRNCRFHKRMEDEILPITEVLCRRYPSAIIKKETGWCGEYRSKERSKVYYG